MISGCPKAHTDSPASSGQSEVWGLLMEVKISLPTEAGGFNLRERDSVTLFHLFEWGGAAFGLTLGANIGYTEYGWVGGILGALVGAPMGWLLGRVPYSVGRLWLHRVLARETVDELRARLKDRVMYSLYVPVMEELRQRGADVRRELPVATTLLAAETAWERHHGWQLLRCFFPDVAATIPDYDPAQPAAQCRAKVASIRSSISTPAGPK